MSMIAKEMIKLSLSNLDTKIIWGYKKYHNWINKQKQKNSRFMMIYNYKIKLMNKTQKKILSN